jgi:FkbM family methyltransferase
MILGKFIPKFIKNSIQSTLKQKSLQMSQAGQDYWVFGEVFNEMRGGYFLDIGAYDGIRISNTYLLEYRYDWNGICVEANPELFNVLKKNRRVKCVNTCLDDKEGFVDFIKRDEDSGIISQSTDNREAKSFEVIKIKTKSLDSLLREENAPDEIDYLSIDIEGAEERVLGNFNFNKYRFNCITIERPSESLKKVLEKNAYILIKEIPNLDCFYIHHSFRDRYLSNLYEFCSKKHLIIRWQ